MSAAPETQSSAIPLGTDERARIHAWWRAQPIDSGLPATRFPPPHFFIRRELPE